MKPKVTKMGGSTFGGVEFCSNFNCPTQIEPEVLDCSFPDERAAFKPGTLQKWALKANMGLGKKVKVLKVLKVNYKT